MSTHPPLTRGEPANAKSQCQSQQKPQSPSQQVPDFPAQAKQESLRRPSSGHTRHLHVSSHQLLSRPGRTVPSLVSSSYSKNQDVTSFPLSRSSCVFPIFSLSFRNRTLLPSTPQQTLVIFADPPFLLCSPPKFPLLLSLARLSPLILPHLPAFPHRLLHPLSFSLFPCLLFSSSLPPLFTQLFASFSLSHCSSSSSSTCLLNHVFQRCFFSFFSPFSSFPSSPSSFSFLLLLLLPQY